MLNKRKRRSRSWENPAPLPTVHRPAYDPTGFKRGLGLGIVILSPDVFSGDPQAKVVHRDRDRYGDFS